MMCVPSPFKNGGGNAYGNGIHFEKNVFGLFDIILFCFYPENGTHKEVLSRLGILHNFYFIGKK